MVTRALLLFWTCSANSLMYSSILPNSFFMYRHRIRWISREAGKLAAAGSSTLYCCFRHFRLKNLENFCNPCLRSRDPTASRVSAGTLLSLLYRLPCRSHNTGRGEVMPVLN
jgi:hypothetical protein